MHLDSELRVTTPRYKPLLNPEPANRRDAPSEQESLSSVADSLGLQAYNKLRVALMSGRFQPGEKLKLRQLAAELGMSLTPIREGLKRLVSEMALVQVDHRSVQLPVLSAERFSEICDLRVLLECRAIAGAVENLSSEDIDKLEQLDRRLVEARRTDHFARSLELNEQFHMAIYQAADKPVLLQLIENLWLQSGPVVNGTRRNKEVFPAAEEHPHTVILRAFRLKDAKLAQNALRQDITVVARQLMPYLRGRLGKWSI